ncbi:hypothetical protein NDU88_002535 [Pleurodeles waltl]|uniref:Uncharacterized protein n=1 Tax=Pleurodeles waltl TaxID=8319 RepID=A0AAV7M0V5_PLEWA|nr:hypothetical protein NDU88_002535 [Pleurodeles waltl]
MSHPHGHHRSAKEAGREELARSDEEEEIEEPAGGASRGGRAWEERGEETKDRPARQESAGIGVGVRDCLRPGQAQQGTTKRRRSRRNRRGNRRGSASGPLQGCFRAASGSKKNGSKSSPPNPPDQNTAKCRSGTPPWPGAKTRATRHRRQTAS